MTAAYVVILTGGALPGEDHADPARYQLDIALEAGAHPDPDIRVRRVAEEAWQLGYAEAAKMHRVVAAWVLGDEEEAARFAAFVTRDIDPAFITRARSPLGELLSAADESRCGDLVPDGAS